MEINMYFKQIYNKKFKTNPKYKKVKGTVNSGVTINDV